jgi:Domain of unknown function DUF1828
MICEQLSTLLGIKCHPLTDDGTVALVDTAFKFQDGDFVPVYVQQIANQVRFFDAGETVMHFIGRGVSINDAKGAKFVKKIAEQNGSTFNENGEIESWANQDNASEAFAKYMGVMLGLVRWEHDQIGVATDTSLLIEEVSMYFRAAYPDKIQTPSPEYIGISGHRYKFDFIHGDDAVLAISTHHASVASALKKLIDLNQLAENNTLSPLVVIDDRYDKEEADNQTKVLAAAARVLPMTSLESKVNIRSISH